jgi:lipopolysaccharide/colanic/teichoic acid biosynthesis glycosyltransferase
MSILRFFDIVISFIALIVLSPFFILIAIAIKINSTGPVFFKQIRVGKNNIDFGLLKFRSMHVDAHKKGLLTIGERDNRITSVGYFLRKSKLDELPQLINVLIGEMSLVGPRPEVRKYVDLYTDEQSKALLKVLPGITDYASIEFRNENDLLHAANDPENFYIKVIIPEKAKLNYKFLQNPSVTAYFKILLLTLWGIIKKSTNSFLSVKNGVENH